MNQRIKAGPWLVLLLLVLVAGLAGTQAIASSRGSGQTLTGTFKLTRGSCTAGSPSGSYFRMIYPGGSLKGGKFFANPDSACSNKTYTLVGPGTDGGLETAVFQPGPATAFDAKGNAKTGRITAPQAFTQIKFGIATLAKDPKTGQAAPAPAITVTNGKLSGQVEAVWAEWNHLYFNQGSPKPGGAHPGLTQAVSGTYNASTGAYVLTWASAISGGPFNGFTGYWHLQGTFVPKA